MPLEWLRRDDVLKVPQVFEAKKATGKDVVDFVKFRQLMVEVAMFGDRFAEQVLARPRS